MKEFHVHAVPRILTVGNFPLINPWKLIDDVWQFWGTVADTLWRDIAPSASRRQSTEGGLSASELAQEQFNQVQWLLYERHIKRGGWRKEVPPARECWRFTQWTRRHSKNFRQLLALYQIDWFRRYADLAERTVQEGRWRAASPELERLLREIELHLYQ